MSTGGRFKFATEEELESAIKAYFDSCRPKMLTDETGAPVLDSKGNPTWERHPPTITGLALALGFRDRVSLYEQARRGKRYADAVQRAKLKIEEFHESLLSTKAQCTGSIFYLKNHGWTDEMSLSGGSVPVAFAAVALTEAEEQAYRKNYRSFFGRAEG